MTLIIVILNLWSQLSLNILLLGKKISEFKITPPSFAIQSRGLLTNDFWFLLLKY